MSAEFEFDPPLPLDKFIQMLEENSCDVKYKQISTACLSLLISKDNTNFIYVHLDREIFTPEHCKQVEAIERYGVNDSAWVRKLIKDYFNVDIDDL